MNASDILTVASIIAGFGVTVLIFRIQRELSLSDKMWELKGKGDKESITEKNNPRKSNSVDSIPTWLPPVDLLVIFSILTSLLLGIIPIFLMNSGSSTAPRLSIAACGASIILLAGYVICVLIHYRFFYGLYKKRNLILELPYVIITFLCAIGFFIKML